jgi:hypothetical protein
MLRLLLLALPLSGCAYRIGEGLVAGALDEVHGDGRTQGISGTADMLLEQQVLSELGHQLGQGLTAGAADIDPEQKAKLEQTIDDLITVAARRTGKGLRNEVSPELREMVQKDIVAALVEGLRGDLGTTLDETVDRVIGHAVSSLKQSLQDEQLELALSDLLRDSVYFAMRESGNQPGVGEVLEATLTEHMLSPIESSVGTITESVALRVDQSARRTENTLRGIIGALVVLTSLIGMLYYIRNRQVRRLQEQHSQAERGLRNLDAALEHLDGNARDFVRAKLQEYEAAQTRAAQVPRLGAGLHSPTTPPPARGDDYQRRH